MINASDVRTLLDYNSLTGEFVWRHRVGDGRQVRRFNKLFAGKVAGNITHQGYCEIRIFSKAYQAHRLAWLWMTGEWPKLQIDHKNGNPPDNRWANLREATPEQNRANARSISRSGATLKGICYNKSVRRFQSQIRIRGRNIHLGLFDTPEEAHHAYAVAAKKYHGEFARVT